MTGFATPPSTTDSTTPLSKCVPGQGFYNPQMEYTRARVVIRFLDYAMAVANDEDGYEGIQFCRYIADIMGKDDTIDWNDFI